MDTEITLALEDEPPSTTTTTMPTALRPGRKSRGSSAWDDWRWQFRNRLRSIEDLLRAFPELPAADEVRQAADRFPLAITPYYASLIRELSPQDPVFRMAIPSVDELYNPPFLREDPLEEDHDMPVPGLVHRYGDRALLLVTMACAMYCRHCTRKRVAGGRETTISDRSLTRAVAYLREHPEIHDVIISGGDPFTMTTKSLERVIAAVRSVPSVDIIRIGTRTPVTMPMRITPELTEMLRRYHPVWVNTHFNHPNELTPAAVRACAMLADAGIPLGNQSVLLRGVNDDPTIIERLCRGLVRSRVRPYYLFQCDLVRGVEHLRTPLSCGIEIMEYLRGRLSGLAIPTYVVDAPGGGGKIPVLPNYVVSTSPTHTVLRNFEGMLVSYPEPEGYAPQRSRGTKGESGATVWDLAAGKQGRIVPQAMPRHERRDRREDIPFTGLD